MLSIEERLSIRDRDTGEGAGWSPWKGTMGVVTLSPPLTTESRIPQGRRDKLRNAKDTGEPEGRGQTELLDLAQSGHWHL